MNGGTRFAWLVGSAFTIAVLFGDISASVAITPPTLGVGTTTPEATLDAHGAQAGSSATPPEPVFGLTSSPDQGNDPKFRVYQGRDQYTTGASGVSNVWLGGITMTGDRSYAITARVLARCTSGTTCGTTAPTAYKVIAATYRSYNGGSSCGISGGLATIAQPSTFSSYFPTLAQKNPTTAPCEIGVTATFPPNATIQVNYILEVMELIE